MQRRDFLRAGAAALAWSTVGRYAVSLDRRKPRRVGLIGTGWYGKIDLVRLMQVEPVEVVSLCDVDRRMLAAAAEMVAGRQASKKKPRTYSDYRQMLKEKDLDIVLIATPDHWHALPMLAAWKRGPTSICRSRSASTWSKARPCWRPPASTARWSRSARSGGARRIWSRPGRRSSSRGSSARWGWSRSTVTITCGPRGTRPISPPPTISTGTSGPGRRRCGPTTPGAPAGLEGVQGVRQRHLGRHVRPHARHDPLDARPGLA